MVERNSCQAFLNGFLLILTFIYLVTGLTITGGSLWLRLDSTFEEMMRKNILRINNSNQEMDDIKKQIRFDFTISFWVICGCGIAATVIGLLGVCGTMFTNRLMLLLNSITAAVLVIAELAIAALIYSYRPAIKETINRYVDLADELDDLLDDINTITIRFDCCSTRNLTSIKCMEVKKLTCATAMWQNLESALILACYCTAGIIIQQTLAVLLCIMKIVSNA